MNKRILMCEPKYFDIEYEINSWMHKQNQVDSARASLEWQKLHDTYTEQLGWDVALIEPVKGLPDMVFATDCCLIMNDKALLSSFRYQQRQPETAHFEAWMHEHGITQTRRAKHYFEGGGDNMVCGDKILAGYGFRSDAAAADELRDYFDCEVVSIRTVDPFFYHLDTSLAVLSHDTVAFYPGAIDETSQIRLRAVVPNIIEATLEEAQGFGLNAVSDGHSVITSNQSFSLLQKYRDAGFFVIGLPILEFRKSGGGVKCLTLDLQRD